jgi:hypothetical protein
MGKDRNITITDFSAGQTTTRAETITTYSYSPTCAASFNSNVSVLV